MGIPDHLNGLPPITPGGNIICPNCKRDFNKVDIFYIEQKARSVRGKIVRYCPYCSSKLPIKLFKSSDKS